MHHPPRAGLALPELLVALVLMAGLALASAPLAATHGSRLHRGRSLLEATNLADRRAALLQAGGTTGCAGTGRDQGRLARVEWQAHPQYPGTALVLLELRDLAGRWPAESVAVLVTCGP